MPLISPIIERQPDSISIGFQPTDLSGLELWLDGQDLSTFTFNGPDVAQWDDKSGNGKNAAQTTAIEQPEFVSNGLNGLPTVRSVHAGAAMGLEISGGLPIGLNVARTLFLVINPTSGFTNSEVLGASTTQMIDFAGDFIFVRDDPRNIVSAAGTVTQDTPHIITVNDDGSLGLNLNAFNETTQILTNQLSAFGWDMAVNLGIGKDVGGNPNRSYHGDISEVILYSRLLTTEENTKVFNYLTARWGF